MSPRIRYPLSWILRSTADTSEFRPKMCPTLLLPEMRCAISWGDMGVIAGVTWVTPLPLLRRKRSTFHWPTVAFAARITDTIRDDGVVSLAVFNNIQPFRECSLRQFLQIHRGRFPFSISNIASLVAHGVSAKISRSRHA